MGPYDYAFLHDELERENTLNIEQLNPRDYQAIYFVDGNGDMFDFPDNQAIQGLLKHMQKNKKVISAVCHGPAWAVAEQVTSALGHTPQPRKLTAEKTRKTHCLTIIMKGMTKQG